MSITMIAGIIIFAVGVLVFVSGVVLKGSEGDGYIFIGCLVCVVGFFIMVSCVWGNTEPEPTYDVVTLAHYTGIFEG